MDNYQLSNLSHIQRASRENRLVVFVGAGVSTNSGLPSWNELIDALKRELPEELSHDTDALKIAQLYKDSRGHKEYMDKVKEILLHDKAVPNPLHRSILSLNPCHIITTNYDDLIEQELVNEFMQYDVVREDKDIPQMVHPNTLVKMHGDFSKDNIVLTEKDYYDYKRNFPLIRAYVQSLFASKLVLFVGFSFADMNLKMILNELQNILSENMQRAYLLSCEEPDHITKQYYEKKGINVLYLSEKEADNINRTNYTDARLTGLGQHTNKVLSAIKNYSAVPKEDLAQYLYERIRPYLNELKSFGDGLKYFFPKDEHMMWHTHTSGLQTELSYFKELAKQLKSNQAKRKFLLEHPNIDLREILRIAYYNYLFEIDGLKIVDENFLRNIDKHLGRPALYYVRRFDTEKVSQILRDLRNRPVQYTINDLELPYTLYALGNYWEAYQLYVKLLPLYWDRKKYILYFICRYNLWAIRNGVYSQLIPNKEFDARKEIELATEKDLDSILAKLPLSYEIKKIFQDLISYKSIGSRVITTQRLREDIYRQRRFAEKGGCSINSNIARLMSLYERESLFSRANFIVCDNNGYYKSLSENNALGILNSFATPPSTMFGGLMSGTRITSLDDFMLEALIFDVEHNRLKEIIKGYEINKLKFDEAGIEYINVCLSGLKQKPRAALREQRLYNPLKNLLLLISKSEAEGINTEDLYEVLIRYLPENRILRIDSSMFTSILDNYRPNVDSAKSFIRGMLMNTYEKHQYAPVISLAVNILKDEKSEYSEFKLDELDNKDKLVAEISLLYPILTNETKEQVLELSLNELANLYDYIFFIYYNRIEHYSAKRFKELLDETDDAQLNERECFILSELRKSEQFQGIHAYIDELANTNDCMRFFIDPISFPECEKVKIEWIFEYEDEGKRKDLLKINAYKERLKQYIAENRLSNDTRRYLINFL